MIYVPKNLFLTIIHRNTTHLLDIYCCHKHQQQRYHNKKTKICKFIHYMFVDRLFLLTKAISIMFEPATTHYQTLQTWIRHNTTRYHNFNALPHTLPYIFSQFSMVWDDLQQVTTRYRQIYKKMYNDIFLTVTRGNPFQIAQNQANLKQIIR